MDGIRARLALTVAAAAAAAGLVLADAATDALFVETSELRQLPILRPVRSTALSRASIEQKVLAVFKEQTTPDEIRASELAMKRLGLVPDDFNLQRTQTALLTEQLAGLYDPQAREFYLADWIDPMLQQPVIVHELTHALQDQHFELRRLTQWPRGDSDARLAAHSLVEGDATLAMMQYVLQKPDVAASYLRSLQNTPKMPVFESVPGAVREALTFPFVQGLQFATALYGRGGWKAVTAAYDPLPQSTEQILHLNKYDAREPPVKITLPDVAAALGPGWKRIDSDVSGEAGYQVILDQFLMAPAESQRAAAGWGGDRYDIYECGGQALVIQMTAWDTEQDALEFADAYTKRTGLRFAGGRRADVLLERRGSRVLVIEGMPLAADGQALTRQLWR
jgi:hypothetical protein